MDLLARYGFPLVFVHVALGADTSLPRVNITYIYANQPPYEEIARNGTKITNVNGIFSVSMIFIVNKHCENVFFHAQEVSSYRKMMR